MIRVSVNHKHIDLLKDLASSKGIKWYRVNVKGIRSIQFCTDKDADAKLTSWLNAHKN